MQHPDHDGSWSLVLFICGTVYSLEDFPISSSLQPEHERRKPSSGINGDYALFILASIAEA